MKKELEINQQKTFYDKFFKPMNLKKKIIVSKIYRNLISLYYMII